MALRMTQKNAEKLMKKKGYKGSTRIAKKKPTYRKELENALDDAIRDIIRLRGKCQRCGKEEVQTAHIFSRKNKSVRWDEDNVLAYCYRCHFHFAHKEPVLFTDWVREHLGEEKYFKLRRKASETKQWTVPELEALLKKLINLTNKNYESIFR